ncbi:MAG: hypothetical protein IPM52_07985 [Bacteroidetes bacterium]|nr:hypothetical protein [Bacteroidota bacterium]
MNVRHLSKVLATLMMGLFFCATVNAQSTEESMEAGGDNRGWNVSAAVGTSVFLGDVKTNPLLPTLRDRGELRYVAALGGERRVNDWLAARAHLAYTHVVGTRKAWDVHFQSFIWESGLTALIYPVNIFTGYDNTRFADFFVVAGIGAINYNTTLYQYSTGNVLAKRGYGNGRGIGGTTLSGILLGGLGADFRLSDKLDFRVEITNKGIDNDLLDTWKSKFRYDVYNHFTLGVVYKFGQRGGGDDLAWASDNNQAGLDLWSNLPPKKEEEEPQEKKDVTDNIQFTPVLELPAETPQPEPVTIVTPEQSQPETITEIPVAQPVASVPASEFRVQIFASNRPFSKATLAKRFKLNENEITEDRFEQFYVYSVGSFSTMEEAMAMRDKLRRENGVSDAFVTIWENGRRTGPRFR